MFSVRMEEGSEVPGHHVERVELVVSQAVHLHPWDVGVDLVLGVEHIGDRLAGHLLVGHRPQSR